MIHTLYYTFADCFCNDVDINIYDYEYYVEPNFQDVLEYEYENKFRKKYNAGTWYLDDEAKKFVKDIETTWLKNQIDVFSLYKNYLFYDWLKEKYYDKALNKASLSCLEETTSLVRSCYETLCYEYDNK